MSSVRSQTSDLGYDGTGPRKTEKPGGNATGEATRSSSSNSNKSRITFEKQKVVPRARTQSVQSVLSCISLRSMMGKPAHDESSEASQNQLPTNNSQHYANYNSNTTNNNNNNTTNNSSSTFTKNVPFTQQIQSPAMTSVAQKRTSNSFFKDGIGQKLPFTDNRRKQLEGDRSTANSRASNRNAVSGNVNGGKLNFKDGQSASDSGTPSGINSSKKTDLEPEDEAEQQKRLTTDALRRLSMMRNGNSGVGSPSTNVVDIEGTTYAQSSERPSSQAADVDSTPTFRDIYCEEPAAHMQFGGKNIVLDSSIPNKRASIAPVRNPLDKLPSALETNSRQRPKSKRPLRQMNEPKKPLYTPAVLRDISETNITNAELGSPGPPVLFLENSAVQTTRSSVRSLRSTSSSMISDYAKKLGSLWSKDHTNLNAEVLRPTRDHWIADNKRHSCHYCHRIFTFWERKHHCRHCGDIFCSQHVRHWLYLDSNAKFLIGGAGAGALSKICDGCLQEYDTLVREGPSTDINPSSDTPKSTTPVPGAKDTSSQKTSVEEGKRGRLESIVGSVPADWNWSSF
ncbi:LAME_0F01222g1_1 [Lachancea meyersii CBS 8951]|uniref:LAME_0F01222g1_1 n=1 Tax=Lachancea meyersii CBS 8951 TaxID=1266667 RepID=A0A1G4JPT2_9SACH|nr:LAME_0F01222g1_1 [Lachancea meyersii CBS 8951]